MKKIIIITVFLAGLAFQSLYACTGISLKTINGDKVFARTIEWGGSDLMSMYVIVPKGYSQISMTPTGENGIHFTSRYGYVGLAVESEKYITEGVNQEGLIAGLFYFPKYGKYPDYNPQRNQVTISDLQLVSYLLGECKDIAEVKERLSEVDVVNIDPRASTAHWRVAQLDGQEIVIEITDGKITFYDNPIGVVTNSPSFDWHLTNLSNYINLNSGNASNKTIGDMQIHSLGNGSAAIGLPGDFTPPSRFVRATFLVGTTRIQETAEKAVEQCFRILNNFDIPIGTEFSNEGPLPDIPGATQWTSVIDPVNGKIYYRTMYNSTIRFIDINKIDFLSTPFRSIPLDIEKRQTMIEVY